MRAVTFRALLIGIGFSIFVNTCSPLTESRAFSNFSWSYLPEGAVIPFLFLLFFNFILYRLKPGLALSQGELLVIFAMALVANSTPIFLIYMFLSAIASPLYYASPENKWQSDLIPHMKPELILNDKLAAKWFFEGLPEGEKIPFKAWLTPLCHWLPFFFVLFIASYLVIVLLRRYWIENEKLAYPLMQVPLFLVERSGEEKLFRSPLFWIGVSIPFLIMAEQALHLYIPALPSLPVDHIGCLNWGWTPVRSQPLFCFNFLSFGVGFFVPIDVLCGIWFFYILTLFEEALFHRFAVATGSGGMFVWGNAAIAWQSLGAFLVFTLSSLYLARKHIARLLLCAFRKYDEEELVPPFLFLPLLLLSIGYMIFWLFRSGMPLLVALIFIPFVLLIYLGLARIVCQAGIFYIVPPVIAQNICIFGLGSKTIGQKGMVALGLSYSWHGDTQDVFSVFASEGAKLWDRKRTKGWHFSVALLIVAGIGLVVAPLFVIYMGYKQGTLTWNTWIYKSWGPSTYEQVLSQIRNPFGFKTDYFLWAAGGAILMLLFTLLHLRFVWWPIHPIGLAVASSFTLYAVYLGAFFAWLVKILLLRWGGLKAFNKATPFFIGLIVGHYLGRTISLVLYSTLGIGMM